MNQNISNIKQISWDQRVDVIIVGSGFSGLSVAIETLNAQLDTLILEKMPYAGGNSAIDAGELSVVGSPQQETKHVKDTPTLLAQDMLINGQHQNDPAKVRYIAFHAHDIYKWTTDVLGVEWSVGIGMAGGHSVPRTITTKTGSGQEIHSKMMRHMEKLGGHINYSTFVEEILLDASGRVTGLKVREGYQFPNPRSGQIRYIRARIGVALCHGGFSADVTYRTTWAPHLTAQYESTNHPGATGELWREAERIGCLLDKVHWIQCTPWNNPKEKGMGIGWIFSRYAAATDGLWVNTLGQRFVNESANRKVRSEAIFEQQRNHLRTLCIVNLAGTQNLEIVRPGYIQDVLEKKLITQFDSIHDIEKAWNIPAGNLEKEIENFNKRIRKKVDRRFHRSLRGVKPLVEGPWLVAEMSPKVHHCLGGLSTTVNGAVLHRDTHEPIPGLWAAGEAAGGVHGACRMGSCAILDCLIMGRAVGKDIATHFHQ